jgi:hypothetical protein
MGDTPDHRLQDRRVYTRIRTALPVMCRKDSGSIPYEGSTMDLSIGGAAIETWYPLTEGELLEFSMAFGSKPISYSAQVVYVKRLNGKRFRAGLQFREMSEGKRRLLKRYLSRLSLETRSFLKDRALHKMISHLSGALDHIKLYTVDHASTAAVIQRSYDSMTQALDQRRKLELRIADNTLIVDEMPLGHRHSLLSKLIEELMTRNIHGLVFYAGITQEEFKVFLSCMNQKPELLMAKGGVERILEAYGVSHLLAK